MAWPFSLLLLKSSFLVNVKLPSLCELESVGVHRNTAAWDWLIPGEHLPCCCHDRFQWRWYYTGATSLAPLGALPWPLGMSEFSDMFCSWLISLGQKRPPSRRRDNVQPLPMRLPCFSHPVPPASPWDPSWAMNSCYVSCLGIVNWYPNKENTQGRGGAEEDPAIRISVCCLGKGRWKVAEWT